MTIEILTGDIFESTADSLVCPVNCVGVMGAGLAKEFDKRYKDASALYKRECRSGGLAPGEVLSVISAYPPPRTLLYFAATKEHWRDPSQIEWVQRCASDLVGLARDNALTQRSVAIPALGVGCGRLSWEAARPILIDAAERLEVVGVKVYLYGPKEGM